MTYKAYIDNIKAKTGKDPEYFLALAKVKGLANTASYLHGSRRIAGWDMAMPTRSFCTSRTPNSQKRSSGKMHGRKSQEVMVRTPRSGSVRPRACARLDYRTLIRSGLQSKENLNCLASVPSRRTVWAPAVST